MTSDAPQQPAGGPTSGRPLSYAQNMEDYHLALALAGTARGSYVDIGGGHPIAGSVSFWFYERGWQGLVVEPQQDLATLHRALRPRDMLVEAVIGSETGEADFYRVERLHALSTTVPRHADAAQKHGTAVQRVRMPALSLSELCSRNGLADIDFLKIDVEGAERDVIAGGDWRRYRPKVVVVEAIAPLTNEPAWQSWEELLLAQGYRFVLFDTLNRFYVAEDRSDILARMPKERAPWDAVTHMYEIGRALESARHPDHALAGDLARGFWASLPFLDDRLVASLLQRGRELSGHKNCNPAPTMPSEQFRLSLGRIACGYDGGHIDE
jgi:FkbM family methyltransferase